MQLLVEVRDITKMKTVHGQQRYVCRDCKRSIPAQAGIHLVFDVVLIR